MISSVKHFQGKQIELEVIRMDDTDSCQIGGDQRERLVVVLGGKCSVTFPGSDLKWEHIGERVDVFSGCGTAFYISVERICKVTADTDTVNLAVISASAKTQREPYLIIPSDILIEQRGEREWRREVHSILRSSQPADALLVGETFSYEGVWSGYPPHKHDTDNLSVESKQEEVYLIRVEPATGFGIFIRYDTEQDRENAQIVKDWESVYVERGFHSVVAAGGHQFYYLWALAGARREFACSTDERHQWLLNT